MTFSHRALSVAILLNLSLVPCNAYAFKKPTTSQKSSLPSVLKADSVRGNKLKNAFTATGNVEVTRANSVVYADEVVYDKNDSTFHALGNVKIKNIEVGNVRATEAQIKEDFSQGEFFDTTLVLNDGSYLTSPKIERKTPLVTDLLSSIYSLCPNPEISQDNALAGEKRDMLSIKSEKVTIDREKQLFKIKSGVLRFYDVPFLYTPYIALPIPSKKRKSGFLYPSYSKNSRLGMGFTTPYYFNIAANKELTTSPTFYPNSGQLLIENDFHHLTSYGEYETLLEVANNKIQQSTNVLNTLESNKEYRWGLKGKGAFDFTTNTGLDFELDSSSDAGYNRDYHNDFRSYSLSQVDLHHIKKRNYYGIKTLKIQEFEEEDVNDPESDPIILPQIDTHIETKPLWYKEKYSLTSNTVAISRESGLQYRRLSAIPAVSVPINHHGNLFKLTAKVQGDFYSLDNNFKYSQATNNHDSVQTNYKPEFSVSWRLPLLKKTQSNTWMVEPMANFVSSSYKRSFNDVPNEDSNDNELTVSNLFTSDRVSGYDRNESGERVSYGAKSSLFTSHGEYGLILGQSIKRGDKTQDVVIRGFNDNSKSNIVGMLSYKALQNFEISYSFHLNESNYRNEINEIITSLDLDRFTFSSNYILLRRNEQNPEAREQLNASMEYKINEKFSTRARMTRDMITGRNLSRSLGVYYDGCCTVFGFTVTESNPINLITPQRSFSISLSFKNL